MESPANIHSASIWQKAAQTIAGVWRPALTLGVLFALIPHVALQFWETKTALNLVKALKEKIEPLSGSSNPDLLRLLSEVPIDLGGLILGHLLVFLLTVTTFFAVLEASHWFHRGKPLPTTLSLLATGIKYALSKGIWVTFILLALLNVIQNIFPMAIFLLFPLFVAPALIIVEDKGVWRSLSDSLRMRYADQLPSSKWVVFFQLASIGATFYLLWLGAELGKYYLLILDDFLPMSAEVWQSTLFGVSRVYWFAVILKKLLLTAVLLAYACFMVTVVYWVRSLSSPLPRQGVRV